MTTPTYAEIEALAVEHEAFGFGRVDAKGFTTHGFDPEGLGNFVRAILAKWGQPQAAPQPPAAAQGFASTLPERASGVPAEQQGLFRKFDVRRVDGSDQPGGKHHGCRYFVLDVDHDQHAHAALTAYAAACESSHPELAADLRSKWGAAPQLPAEAQEPTYETIQAMEKAWLDVCHDTSITSEAKWHRFYRAAFATHPAPQQAAPADGGTLTQAARPRKDTRNPCAMCGWSEHMAVHQPKEKPWGHAYQAKPGREQKGGA